MGSIQQVRRGYNQISGFYDFLQGIVFGNTLRHAEIKSIQLLKNCNVVLVIGGGSGFFLEHLVSLGIPTIIYIELSDKMIEKAKRRVERNGINTSKIMYINKSWNAYKPDAQVDAIVNNFFLDMFDENTIGRIIEHYSSFLKPRGTWYCTDFYSNENTSRFTNLLIKSMYIFFVATCGIEARKLPSIFKCFKDEKFTIQSTIKSSYLQQTLFIKK